MYKTTPDLFWAKLWDPDDTLRDSVQLLLADGAHRRYVANKKNLPQMRVAFLRPTISYGELVALVMHVNQPMSK